MIEKAVQRFLSDPDKGASHSVTHRFKGSSGTTLYITMGIDEFNVPNSMFINIGASGTTIHNVCNALARVVSIAIQNDKATLLQIVQTMENVGSETRWISDTLGVAESIPSAIALVLLHHVEIDEALDKIHNFDEECDNEFRD
jgi:hypothetical protein